MTHKNYRKLFNGIPEDWDVHHVDMDHSNNEPSNLIALPRKFHQYMHERWGYAPREEIVEKLYHFLREKPYTGFEPNRQEVWENGAPRDGGLPVDYGLFG